MIPNREASAHFVIDKDGAKAVPIGSARPCSLGQRHGSTSNAATDNRYYGRSELGSSTEPAGERQSLHRQYWGRRCWSSGGTLTTEQLAASIDLHRYVIGEVKRLYGVAIPVDRAHIAWTLRDQSGDETELCPGKDFPYNKILEGLQKTWLISNAIPAGQ